MTLRRFTIQQIEAAQTAIDPVFQNSPQYECESLSRELGVSLFVKLETLNPIRSFKGRGADLLIQNSSQSKIVCASAGNFGQAMAYAGRKRKVAITIFASVHANPLKIERMRSFGAEVILTGADFDAAKIEARKFAEATQSRFVEDSLDVETVIGAGTIGLEISKIQGLEEVLIPLGNGALLNGVATVLRTRSPQTKVVAVQAAGAPAMIESLRQGAIISHEKIDTIADGIGVRLPVAQALHDMSGLVDDMYLVKDETILQAMRLIHQHVGVIVEPSGAVGVAAILENKQTFEGKRVATIFCGSNLTQQQVQNWILN